MGARTRNWDFFIIPKFINWDNKIISERANREIANFHLLRWRATKMVKVVVWARSPTLLSLLDPLKFFWDFGAKLSDSISIRNLQFEYL